MHPLSGSNIRTLVRALVENGGVSREAAPQAALALAATLARWPATALEKAYVTHRLARIGAMPPPIFIVGHWRSGTTHLYNIMSKGGFGFVEPLAAGMPWDLLGLVKAARPLLERKLPADRFIDSIPVTPDSPQEDEVAIANMTRMSFYHALYFPRFFEHHFNRGVFFDGCSEKDIEEWQDAFVHFLRKVWLQQNRRQLLIKNPVYTARLAMLREIFPGAKFIHVFRNPYEVLQSMQNFYEKLLQQFALQDYDALPIDGVILKTYSRMMDRLIQETEHLPDDEFIEIRYERLEKDPLAEIKRVYDAFDLDGFATARPAFESYLASIRTYKKNRYAFSEENLALVEREWGRYLDRWQYRRPPVNGGIACARRSAAGVAMLKRAPLALAVGFLVFIGLPPACAALASGCRHVAVADGNGKAVRGIEDIAVDAGARIAYLSADDRWAVEDRAAQGGPDLPQGGIYLLPLDDASLRAERIVVADLTAHFKTENAFHPHGIDLVFDAEGRGTLYVINRRYQRQSAEQRPGEWGGSWEVVPTVEIFDVGEGKLHHRRTLRSGAFCRANEIAGLGRGRFLLTNDGVACGRWGRRLEQAFGLRRGNALLVELEEATGASAVRAVAGRIGFANGLALDRQHLYVAATRDQALLVFPRDSLNRHGVLGAPERIIALGGGPDNLSWASDHILLVAVHPSLLRLAAYRYRWGFRGMFRGMSWTDTAPTRLLAVNVRDGAQRVVWASDAGEPLSAATVAVRHGNVLIAGSVTDAGLMLCDLNQVEN